LNQLKCLIVIPWSEVEKGYETNKVFWRFLIPNRYKTNVFHLLSTPLIKVENTLHLPSVDVVARYIWRNTIANKPVLHSMGTGLAPASTWQYQFLHSGIHRENLQQKELHHVIQYL
jgi:hypothetical protein